MLHLTIADLLTMLKAELRNTLESGSTANDSIYTRLINNKIQWFASEYDWPLLADEWDISSSDSTFAIPTTSRGGVANSVLNIVRPYNLCVLDCEEYVTLDAGIGPVEHSQYDDADTNQIPYRHELYSAAGLLRFRVWPVPSQTQSYRLYGQRVPETLTTTEKCLMDGLMIVYSVAADELAARKSPDANAKAALAQQRLIRVRQQMPSPERRVVFGALEDARRREYPRVRPQLT